MIHRSLTAIGSLSAVIGLTLAGTLLGSSNANAFPKSNLTVRVDNIKTQKGQVCLSLFNSGQGFPDQGKKAVRSQCVKVTEIPMAVTFENLPGGSYAVAVMHDVNNNGEVDRNGLGIPTEGFGFSRNPRILTGPPKFGDTQVLVAGDTEIAITLQHL